ncbi:MAG TPA: short-chain dehydrogenase [bacterium]|nr:short-chain dehydrogenase [bacterium]
MTQDVDKENNSKTVSPQDFLLKIPLYEDVAINENGFHDLEYFKGSVDCFCLECGRHSVFISKGKEYRGGSGTSNYQFHIVIYCTRDENHRARFVFLAHDGHIRKIGQYPSQADLTTPDLQKYRKVLGDDRFPELARGVGLISHGVGIGAFVYLRRIFEHLISEARQKAKGDEHWKEEDFEKARMDERIALLHDYLPSFLVENRLLYGILSKGVHDLTENDCLEAFPIVKLGIELILDEELERHSRAKKVQNAKKEIGSLGARLKRES